MSASTSSRQRPTPAPLRNLATPSRKPPPVPPPSLPMSKSQQLARAVALADGSATHDDGSDHPSASAQHQQHGSADAFRPDSLWSEGGADVVWQGNGVGSRSSPLPSPALPSPGMFNAMGHHHIVAATESSHQGEFADADEGYDDNSDDMHSADDNTTFTTLSTGSSVAKKGSSYGSAGPLSPSHRTPLPPPPAAHTGMPLSTIKANGAAVPSRPQRKAPRPAPAALDIGQDAEEQPEYAELDNDDEDEAEPTFGHARPSSVGSSIWAGRGAKSNGPRPPVPSVPNQLRSPMLDGAHPQPRGSFDEAASVYSQGAASEWDNTQHHHQQPQPQPQPQRHSDATRYLEETPPLDRLRQMGDRTEDEFEMMDTQSIYEGRNSVASSSYPTRVEPERRLPDGTLVPKMPPLPPQHSSDPKQSNPRSRSKKGRQHRSPVLSYADGEEEEQRLVQERELRESGGTDGLMQSAASSSLGPRLKKNSPAPWEMDDDSDMPQQQQRDSLARPVDGLSTRPSMENLFASSIKQPTTWARQSVEQFRSRTASSNGGASNAGASPYLSSSRSNNAFSASNNSMPFGASGPGSSPLAGADTSQRPVPNASSNGAADESGASRRQRTKSVSGSAAGMLKGLGLASSTSSNSSSNAATPTKKASSSRLAKAFRSNKGAAPNAASGGGESGAGGRKQSINLSRGISSDDYAHLPPSPPPPPPTNLLGSGKENASNLSVATSPYLAHSNHSHSSLSQGSPLPSSGSPAPPVLAKRSGSTNAHNASADGHSLASSSTHSGARSRGDMREATVRNISGGAISSADTTTDSSMPHTPALSMSGNKTSPQKMSFTQQQQQQQPQRIVSPAASQMSSFKAAQVSGVPVRKSSTSSEGGGVVVGGEQHPSQDSHRSSATGGKPGVLLTAPSAEQMQAGATSPGGTPMNRLPSVGSHEGVPYKLISLEQARMQQQKQQNQGPSGGVRGADEVTGLPSSPSDKSVPDVGDRERSLKGKKSGGFLRRFGKDRAEDGVGPMPSFGPSSQLQQIQQREAAAAQQPQAPPTLSVRPMSSMFTGLAPGLFDSMTVGDRISEADEAGPDADMLSPTTGALRAVPLQGLSPHSPAITVASVDSNQSGADYYDAVDRAGSEKHQQHLGVGASTGATLTPRGGASPALQPRGSTDSTHSDTSSALGLVSGFPALPATGHGATAASLTSKAPVTGAGSDGGVGGEGPSSLARATRQRALEIEAAMTELHAELVKLRMFAIDSGLTRAPGSTSALSSPNPATGGGATFDSMSMEMLSTPPMPSSSLPGNGDSTDEQLLSPQSQPGAASGHGPADEVNNIHNAALMTPIPPCTQCGCLCADEKRLQSLNELTVLKGISILDRGRALKPLAGQNGSKFGGYLDR